MDLFELTKALIDIPSPTGSEGSMADFLADDLRARSFHVRLQRIEGRRRNVFASAGRSSRVVLCTHMDTVSGFFPASEDETYIYGRGACDAKGIMAAMITAASVLRDDGAMSIALLFVVGEEGDSIGAKKAAELRPKSSFIIVGEPTENKLGSGHKGVLTFTLKTAGRKAHSAYPEKGVSAVEKLLDVLQDLRRFDLGRDPLLGSNTLNIGTIEGGEAYNVVSDSASALVSVRAATATGTLLRKISAAVGGRAELEILTTAEPQRLHSLPGFECVVLPFGTDIPYLGSFGKPLLLGPGSIEDAHTDGEKIEKEQLSASVGLYEKIVRVALADG